MPPNRSFSSACCTPGEESTGGALVIDTRTDPYAYLGTRGPFPIVIDQAVWPSAEHYVIARRTADESLHASIRATLSVRQAAARVSGAPVRPDWSRMRDEVLRQATTAKLLQQPRMAAALLATGIRPVIVRSGHGDANVIGDCLMDLRTRLPQITAAATARAAPLIPDDLHGQPWVMFGGHTLVWPWAPAGRRIASVAFHALTLAAHTTLRETTGAVDSLRLHVPGGAVLLSGPATHRPVSAALREAVTCVWLPHVTALPPRSR